MSQYFFTHYRDTKTIKSLFRNKVHLFKRKWKISAAQLNTEMADHKFKASTGWLEKFKTRHRIRLEKFKTRHGIRYLSIQSKKLSAADKTVEPFLQKLLKVMEEKNLIPEQN